MPTLEEFNPDDLRDLWGSCFIIHAAEIHKSNGQYAYLGQNIVNAHDKSTIKEGCGNMISPSADQSKSHFMTVAQSGKPLLDEGEFSNANGELVKYRQCLLPLGTEGNIEAVFGGMSFKVFLSESAE